MNKRKLSFLAALIAGGFIAGVFLLLFTWQKGQQIYSNNQEGEELPVMEVTGVKFTELDEYGRKLWVLIADRAVQFPRRNILENGRLKLYDEGDLASEGTAREVTIENATSNLLLRGKILFESYRNGAELTTSELRWNNSEKKLYTDQEVTIKRENLVLRGIGLTGNSDLSLITIENPVTTYFEGGH